MDAHSAMLASVETHCAEEPRRNKVSQQPGSTGGILR